MDIDLVRSSVAATGKAMRAGGIKSHAGTSRRYFTGYGDTVYDWELLFDTIVLGYFGDTDLTINGIRIFLDAQREDGFIPRRVLPSRAPQASGWGRDIHDREEEEHCKPFLLQSALMVCRLRGDASWLGKEDYRKLVRYLDHWMKGWDRDGNGLSEWASGPHSGADTQFERIGPWRSRYCEGVDLNCYLVWECLAAARLAQRLGLSAEAESRKRQAGDRIRRIRELLWDEAEGMYYDRDARTGERIRVKAGSAFLTLRLGVATEDQARRLVEEHLSNPKEFWTPYPVSSYARSEPGYTQRYVPPAGSDPVDYLREGHCNWCGGLWPHWDYLIAHGLVERRFAPQAARLAEGLLRASMNPKGLSEWYNAETGEACGMNPFWAGASVLGLFLPSELRSGVHPMEIADPDSPLDLDAVRKELAIRIEPL